MPFVGHLEDRDLSSLSMYIDRDLRAFLTHLVTLQMGLLAVDYSDLLLNALKHTTLNKTRISNHSDRGQRKQRKQRS